jgi:hypothetical protein
LSRPTFSDRAPPRPPGLSDKVVVLKDGQEHFLRRLGAALVLQWDDLPDDVQDLLIDEAAMVDDADPALHGRSEIETFLRKVKTVHRPTQNAANE